MVFDGRQLIVAVLQFSHQFFQESGFSTAGFANYCHYGNLHTASSDIGFNTSQCNSGFKNAP
jgi:hypothetical protein